MGLHFHSVILSFRRLLEICADYSARNPTLSDHHIRQTLMTGTIPNFEFATATRIIFGAGQAASLGKLAREYGQRALFVTGSSAERVESQRQNVEASGVNTIPF